MKRSVVIFTNSRVEADDDAVWTTEALHDFLAQIGENRNLILASASADRIPGSRYNSATRKTSHLRLLSLGRAFTNPSTSCLEKTLGYGTAFLRILFQVPKKPIWYVFLPGHMGTLACLIGSLLGKQFGIYVRGEWPTSGIAGRLYRLYFKRATFIIATGAAFTERLRQFNGHVEEVAPMMRFCLKDFREKPSYEVIGRARLLYVGEIGTTKGVFETVKALPDVAKECDVELKIVGSGSPEVTRNLQIVIDAGGCHDRIELVGYIGDQRELAEWFASADVFVFPTYYREGFPRVVYEAMAFGLPVICTHIEGGRLFLREGENCHLVVKKDVEGLAHGLVTLLKDQPLRTALGKRAFQDAMEFCSRFVDVSHGSQLAEAIEEVSNVSS